MSTLERRPKVGLLVLLWLGLAGLIGSLAWGFFSYEGLQDRLAELPRSVVPGQIDVEVVEPQTQTIFFEDPSADQKFGVRSSPTSMLETPPVDLIVTGPSGERIDIQAYERDLRFDHDGRVLIAMATFEPAVAGRYSIEMSGDVPAGAEVSAGDVVDFGLVANFVALVGLFILSVVALAVAVVLRVGRRGRGGGVDQSDVVFDLVSGG